MDKCKPIIYGLNNTTRDWRCEIHDKELSHCDIGLEEAIEEAIEQVAKEILRFNKVDYIGWLKENKCVDSMPSILMYLRHRAGINK